MNRYWLVVPMMALLGWLLVGSVSAETNLMLTYAADYHDNQWLSGEPVLQRKEQGINFNWGTGSPGRNVSQDFFSARWTSSFTLNENSTLRFYAQADDGIRILINGKVVLNAYNGEAKPGFTTERKLAAGPQEIVVEYYEHSGEARAQVVLTVVEGSANAGGPAVGANDCVIPATGPWPPCATGGGSTPIPAPPSPTGGDCVIPPSGPWPPCATGGGQPAAPAAPNDCVIPPSGPWPDCAK